MNTEIEQRRGDQEMQESHREPEAYSLEAYKPRRLQSNLIFGAAGAVAVGGFGWLLWASAAAEIASPISFITSSCLVLFLIVVAIAQFGLYWSQRDLTSAQWNAMERGLERTDRMIEKMQSQLVAVERQAETMDRSLAISTRAYIEVHSIESNPDTGFTVVVIENIGKLPATDIKIVWRIFARKDGKIYKDNRASREYGRLAPGNFKIRFDFHFLKYFAHEEILSILDASRTFSIVPFLEFRIGFHDGFEPRLTPSWFAFDRLNKTWLPVANSIEETPPVSEAIENCSPQNSESNEKERENPQDT